MKKLLILTLLSGLSCSALFGAQVPTPVEPETEEQEIPTLPAIPQPAQPGQPNIVAQPQATAAPTVAPQAPTVAPQAQAQQPQARQAQQPKLELVNIDISAADRKQSAAMLNILLASEYVLYVRTLNYHWNVKGPLFGPLHELFKGQYEALEKIIDDVAERARALNEPALGTMQEFITLSKLKEIPNAQLDEGEMIKNLLDGHEAIIRMIRVAQQDAAEKYKDMGTNNLLLNLIEKHEKIAWMLRAHLAHLML